MDEASTEELRAKVDRLRTALANAEDALRRRENELWRAFQRERDAAIRGHAEEKQ
jgi:hypothetical protein